MKTKTSKNKLKYIEQYDKSTYRNISFKVRKDYKEILDKLDSVPSKSAYIMDLIRKDIEKEH